MSEHEFLPIKVVPSLETDFYKPEAHGGPKKVFETVTPAIREQLASQIIDIRNHFKTAFQEYPDVPVVAQEET